MSLLLKFPVGNLREAVVLKISVFLQQTKWHWNLYFNISPTSPQTKGISSAYCKNSTRIGI